MRNQIWRKTFIEGINPKVNDLIDEMLKSYLCDLSENYEVIMSQYCEENKIELFPPSEDMKNVLAALGYAYYNTFIEKVDEIKRHTSGPFVAMVDSLDKLELAELAESLVNLTSLKRKVSLDAETVGGPIDVAIITKNEGFIWVKRKYYFDSMLNPFYNEKKRREVYGD
nr:hypothetical protein [uncultured Aminipila sp.]